MSKVFETEHTKHDVKIGGFNQYRTRNFAARLLGYTKYNNPRSIINPTDALFNNDLLLLDESQIFNSQNMGLVDGPGDYDGGFKLSESTTYIDTYQASSFLNAVYIMSDSRFFEKLRFYLWLACGILHAVFIIT